MEFCGESAPVKLDRRPNMDMFFTSNKTNNALPTGNDEYRIHSIMVVVNWNK